MLEWGGPDTPHGMKWDKDADGKGLPETAHYVCVHSGCVITDADKPAMVAGGEWRATAPFNGHAGFHIWTAYSLFPKAAWPNLVAEWLEVKDDPNQLQTFINTVLGEPYEDRGERALKEDRLLARCERFAAEVPDGVAVITAGVDVQDDRSAGAGTKKAGRSTTRPCPATPPSPGRGRRLTSTCCGCG